MATDANPTVAVLESLESESDGDGAAASSTASSSIINLVKWTVRINQGFQVRLKLREKV